MLQSSLNPKYQAKYNHSSQANFKQLPASWDQFAPLTKIRSGASVISFNPYGYQKILVEQIQRHKTTVITKGRQLGLTETISNYFLYKACKNQGYLAVIFSKSQSDTSNIAKRLRRQVESLHEYVTTETDSLTDLKIKNGGRILFRNSTANGARGLESVSDILYDEASFVDEIEEIYKSSIPCTTTVGDAAKIIILSTPNGQSGWYWEKLTSNNGNRDLLDTCNLIKSEKIDPIQYWTDENGWLKFIVHWLAHPTFNIKKDTYLSNIQKQFELPKETVEQEYNLSFTDSATLVFNASLIRDRCIGYKQEYDPDKLYFMGLDTSLLGDDYTVLTIFQINDNSTYQLVDMYRERKQTHQYNIFQISALIDKYKPLKVAVEVNSSGQIYYEELSQAFLNVEFKPIKTTASSKPVLINHLILALERKVLTLLNDKYLIKEFLSFRKEGQKLEATPPNHDDIVLSTAFGLACISDC